MPGLMTVSVNVYQKDALGTRVDTNVDEWKIKPHYHSCLLKQMKKIKKKKNKKKKTICETTFFLFLQ